MSYGKQARISTIMDILNRYFLTSLIPEQRCKERDSSVKSIPTISTPIAMTYS